MEVPPAQAETAQGPSASETAFGGVLARLLLAKTRVIGTGALVLSPSTPRSPAAVPLRSEARAASQAREHVVRTAENLMERRRYLQERGIESAQERLGEILELDAKSQSIPVPATAALVDLAIQTGQRDVSPRDAVAAVAALVERMELFHRGRLTGVRVGFSHGDLVLAVVEIERTAKGEVAMRLSPSGRGSRAELGAWARALRHGLQERGLRVSALVIG